MGENTLHIRRSTLRYIMAACAVVAICVPAFNILYVAPAFKRQLVNRQKEESVRIARHFKQDVVDSAGGLKPSVEYGDELTSVRSDFDIVKIKVFDSSGKVVYSTDERDIGVINSKPYFLDIIANGNEHVSLVAKEHETMEGVKSKLDVVETYVPIMQGARFAGAFEIYHDVTDQMSALRNMLFWASAVPVAAMAAFIFIVIYLLNKVEAGIGRLQAAERELDDQRAKLERAVQDRTAALRALNDDLEEEIVAHKTDERALRDSERFLNMVFQSIIDPFCIFNTDLTIVKANEGYARQKGRPVADLIGKRCFEALERRSAPCEDCVVNRTFANGIPNTKEKCIRMPDGKDKWIEIITYPIFDDKGVSHVIEYTRDITPRVIAERERKSLIRELEHLSTVDGMTSLLNRRTVTARLELEIARARRYGHPLSVILLDLDNLKQINDKCGHNLGDMAIRVLASTILSQIGDSGFAGRYGGDEFLIVIPEKGIDDAVRIAEELRAMVTTKRSPDPAHPNCSLTTSIGVAAFEQWMKEVSDIVKKADSALYESKSAGKNRVTTAPPAGPA